MRDQFYKSTHPNNQTDSLASVTGPLFFQEFPNRTASPCAMRHSLATRDFFQSGAASNGRTPNGQRDVNGSIGSQQKRKNPEQRMAE